MTIYYWGTYDRDYPRNRILIAGLRANGAEVREFHFPIWRGPADKVRRAGSGWIRPALLFRWAWAYLILSVRLLRAPRPDFLFVGYSGHFDVFPAWCLSRMRRVPLVFDAFLSLYDSLVLDRGIVAKDGWRARFLAAVDATACRLADRILLDTRAHVSFFCETFRVPREKFWELPIGADDNVFRPGAALARNGHPYTVIHFGRYIPLHGLETIVRAARRLEEEGQPVRFLLVGDGEGRRRIEDLARTLGTTSIRFEDSLAPRDLAESIRQADLCLGIFGVTDKAARVVPNKVYEALASGKPLVTGDSPAAREFLTDELDCLLCERGDPGALASAIRRLQTDPELSRRLGDNGRRRFEAKASPAVIGRELVDRLLTWRHEGRHAA
ncbi:MAG TPA: glycosyltransferase [Candidatus Polarisedimenticolia bacterium]|jgi:glycosyltransferase involved in cell wall biosynthesis|nr:glycosyltransferase [Candidatus Polarisedimenticolia bacterium]